MPEIKAEEPEEAAANEAASVQPEEGAIVEQPEEGAIDDAASSASSSLFGGNDDQEEEPASAQPEEGPKDQPPEEAEDPNQDAASTASSSLFSNNEEEETSKGDVNNTTSAIPPIKAEELEETAEPEPEAPPEQPEECTKGQQSSEAAEGAKEDATSASANSSKDKDMEQEETKPEFYCSMCWEKDTEDKLLFQCKDCGVVYHNECYRGVSMDTVQLEGLKFQSNENGLFEDQCMACAAVGKTVKGRTGGGLHNELKVTMRPYECCLCSVDDPSLPLPMHPVYDRNNGRQLLLERWKGAPAEVPKHRLAWAHTLCAIVVGTYSGTGGCVYSCHLDGEYGGREADDDDRSCSSEVEEARRTNRTDKPAPGADPIQTLAKYGYHHFCIVMMKKWKAYAAAIKKVQQFTCKECLADDKKDKIWRMALPCMCKEKDERKDFKACHPKGTDDCFLASHVGCAMWGKRINGKQQFPKVRRVYFEHDPRDYSYDLCLCYCNKHAKDIRDNGAKRGIDGCTWLRFPGYSGKKAISEIGSEVPNEGTVEMINTKDTIDSDIEDDYDAGDQMGDDDVGFDDDLEVIGVTHSDDEGEGEGGGKKKKKDKSGNRNRKDGINKGVKRPRAPPKVETARDRLEKKLNKRGKTTTHSNTHGKLATVGGSTTSFGEGIKQEFDSTTTKSNRGLATTLELKSENNDDNNNSGIKVKQEEKKPPPKKPRKKALVLSNLFKGKGLDFGL